MKLNKKKLKHIECDQNTTPEGPYIRKEKGELICAIIFFEAASAPVYAKSQLHVARVAVACS